MYVPCTAPTHNTPRVSFLQGKFEEADSLFCRGLDMRGATVRGEEHIDYTATLDNRVELLKTQVKP